MAGGRAQGALRAQVEALGGAYQELLVDLSRVLSADLKGVEARTFSRRGVERRGDVALAAASGRFVILGLHAHASLQPLLVALSYATAREQGVLWLEVRPDDRPADGPEAGAGRAGGKGKGKGRNGGRNGGKGRKEGA